MQKPTPKPPRKTALVAIRMDPETKASAEAAAAADDRSLSQWITALIKGTLKGKRRG
jgi:predicted HicB family RNase H-like nuclease